jgi:xanthine dehydrogenase accessory factor
LMELPLRLTWVDSRAEQFPAQRSAAVEIWHSPDPVASVAAAPRGTRFLVMTHSHPLDYALCRAILERNDFAWAGLIGSMSKAARFRSRLARDGVGAQAIARLVCPIGIEGITSKWPAAIAVGVAAQVMQEISAGVNAGRQGRAAAPTENDCPRIACASCGSSGVVRA